MKYINIFKKPSIIGIIGDVNSGKSNLIYDIEQELKKVGNFSLYTFGLKTKLAAAKEIYSVNELEQIKNSIIVIDEMISLFDLDNRKIKKQIESTLRLINHNNNVLVLCGVPENYKKFLASKLNYIFYKKVTFADFINGSKIKEIVLNYKGHESGNTLLDLKPNEALFYDGLHYSLEKINYISNCDSKKQNVPIFVPKSVPKNVENKKSNK